MRLKRRVDALEVKRCFVCSSLYAKRLRSKSGKVISETALLSQVVEAVLGLSEKAIDKKIGTEYKKRLRLYNSCTWYIGTFSPHEVGMWKGAGGLPPEWTRGTLAQTAALVKKNVALVKTRGRAKTVPFVIARHAKLRFLVQKHKYLLPIIAPGGTMGRRGLLPTKGDLDDGNMRSLGLTLAGARTISAYIGTI